MSHAIKTPKKLIEVALPLEAINSESLRRKQKAPKGWPTSFHKWWAQRPIAAARAVIFGQLVNDPSWSWELQHPGETPPSNLKASWAASRKRLFSLLQELVLWENSFDESILAKAHEEIQKSWRETCELNQFHPRASELFNPNKLPRLHDPFAGSGTIPLEAQRLGLEVLASDFNPVAVLINKAMIQVPPRFSRREPIGPISQDDAQTSCQTIWPGTTGMAEDIRRYGAWMKKAAAERIGRFYPNLEITDQMAAERPDLKPLLGRKLTVTAWIWARTVKSPNPAFRHVDVPLASTFILSIKGGGAYVEPVISGESYRFTVKVGSQPTAAKMGTKLARGANFRCLLSGAPIEGGYIKAEGKAGRMGARLMAIVAEGARGRVYVAPTLEQEKIASSAQPDWRPDVVIAGSTQYLGIKPYGMDRFSQLFTDRQLLAHATMSELVFEACEQCKKDAIRVGMTDDGLGLDNGGTGATAYAEAIATYLAFVVDRMVFYSSSLCGWLTKDNAMGKSMPQQALAMSWDFAEGNPFGKSSSDILTCTKAIADCVVHFNSAGEGSVELRDACTDESSESRIISTDPPYYANVPYADLSDFFYVWLRRSLKPIFPNLFATIAVPKTGELVAFAHRHENGKDGAEAFFLEGMTGAMTHLRKTAHPAFPVTIYYAFKQAETDESTGTVSTGWETFLEAVIRAGFAISGTWPMRTEGESRMRAADSNALASSIVLVCRPRASEAQSISRRVFVRELNHVLPEALDEMTRGLGGDRSPVAPVDLSQAIIGPGMAVFSKYASVLEADGKQMSVRTALQLINRFLAEDDFDHDTQFCLHWFEQYGWKDGKFGDADTLARAKGTSVDGVKKAGVLYATSGVVRLVKWADYPTNWDPTSHPRLPVWEALHHLIRVFYREGETGAGAVLAAVQTAAGAARQLAYRLYTLCERSGWAEDARAYNEIITSWSAIETAAARVPGPQQAILFES